MSTQRAPLGSFLHARSGDKGGNANIGVWVRHGDDPEKRRARIDWLLSYMTPEKVNELLPETVGLPVTCHPLENLGGLNIVIEGILGEGVAASTRFDPQAKALGEWLRSRYEFIPTELM